MATRKGDAMSEQDEEAATVSDGNVEEFDPDDPIVLTPRSEEEKAKIPRVVLFTLDDKKYTIPNEVKPHIAQGYLYQVRNKGMGQGEAWLAEKLLGREAYEALMNFDDLTQEQSDQIFSRARAVVFGRRDPKAVAKVSGKASSTAPRKRPSSKRKNTPG